jgi:hypothetical protein
MSEAMERIVTEFDQLMAGVRNEDAATMKDVKSLLHQIIDAAKPSQLAILLLGPRVLAERETNQSMVREQQSRKRRPGSHR